MRGTARFTAAPNQAVVVGSLLSSAEASPEPDDCLAASRASRLRASFSSFSFFFAISR